MSLNIIPKIRDTSNASQSSRASFSGLDQDTQRESSKRLGGMALIYSIGYLLANGPTVAFHFADVSVINIVATLFSIVFGLVVFWICKRGQLPMRWFPTFAIGFEVLAVLGIVVAAWGWEQDLDRRMQKLGDVLGFTSDNFLSDLIGVLDTNHINLIPGTDVSWIGVVIILFPMIVPLSPRRTFLSSFLSATAAIGLLILSPAVNGVPESIAPWINGFVFDIGVSTFICAILATVASRTVYRLARDLSKERRMGSYQLVEKIGEGGMGEVWKAKHRLLARPAAIKLIRPEMLGAGDYAVSEAAKSRFEREAQATADLQSPHTIELYDFGVTNDTTFYFVMEFLNGLDLRSLVERHGPIPPARAVYLLSQVCHSLDDAHASGLVHRDVKPANIFVCRRGSDFDFVKVLDFGMVKRASNADLTDVQLTQEGGAAGTPAFMAPESVEQAGDADARVDIYALGCVGYWLLTGQLVFEGETPIALLIKHAREEAPAPSSRTEIEIPALFDEIILDCLAKDPDKRPQTARELKCRLDECAKVSGLWDSHQAEEWWAMHAPEHAPGRAKE